MLDKQQYLKHFCDLVDTSSAYSLPIAQVILAIPKGSNQN